MELNRKGRKLLESNKYKKYNNMKEEELQKILDQIMKIMKDNNLMFNVKTEHKIEVGPIPKPAEVIDIQPENESDKKA